MILFLFYIKLKNKILKYFNLIITLGIGDWGLGIGDWAQSPIPNPHVILINKKYFFI